MQTCVLCLLLLLIWYAQKAVTKWATEYRAPSFARSLCIKIASANKILKEIAVRDAHTHQQRLLLRNGGVVRVVNKSCMHCMPNVVFVVRFVWCYSVAHLMLATTIIITTTTLAVMFIITVFAAIISCLCKWGCVCVHSHVIYDAIELDCSFAKTV